MILELFFSLFLVSQTYGTRSAFKLKNTGFNGFNARILNDSRVPTIVFGSQKNSTDVYCLLFVGSYEATSFNATSRQIQKVPTSNVNYRGNGVSYWNYNKTSNTSFQATAVGVKKADFLQLNFKFVKVNLTNATNSTNSSSSSSSSSSSDQYGLEYSLTLKNYSWTNPSAYYVFQLQVKGCGNYKLDSSSSSSAANSSRRLMGNGKGSDSSESVGVSSDDSEEFDFDRAVFRNTPQASKECPNQFGNGTDTSKINVTMVYDSESYISLVFQNFNNCDLVQDPIVYTDNSKYEDNTTSSSASHQVTLIFSIFAIFVSFVSL